MCDKASERSLASENSSEEEGHTLEIRQSDRISQLESQMTQLSSLLMSQWAARIGRIVPAASVEPIHYQTSTEFGVTVKEPLIPRAEAIRIKKIGAIQRFGSSEWTGLRFAETQKKYAATPVSTDLEVTEELRQYDQGPTISQMTKRTFAALSNALLAQQEALRDGLQPIVDSAAERTIAPELLLQLLQNYARRYWGSSEENPPTT